MVVYCFFLQDGAACFIREMTKMSVLNFVFDIVVAFFLRACTWCLILVTMCMNNVSFLCFCLRTLVFVCYHFLLKCNRLGSLVKLVGAFSSYMPLLAEVEHKTID